MALGSWGGRSGGIGRWRTSCIGRSTRPSAWPAAEACRRLLDMVAAGKAAAGSLAHAHILLKAEAAEARVPLSRRLCLRSRWDDVVTVERVRQRSVKLDLPGGVELVALDAFPRRHPAVTRPGPTAGSA
ncbi:MAG: hypothetical protein KatS3mg108_2593 [Isosphaeraceae bacterium]|nr:MAG: hypothetical protein KatS3mg108_2593 [Isosphaeraceae bacterium]